MLEQSIKQRTKIPIMSKPLGAYNPGYIRGSLTGSLSWSELELAGVLNASPPLELLSPDSRCGMVPSGRPCSEDRFRNYYKEVSVSIST
jgi:hypothetical protein